MRGRKPLPSNVVRLRGNPGKRRLNDAEAAGRVGLGHRRLSIVDVAAGHQPMTNEDGSLHITYNGEIYNHAEFRPLLEARGHAYRTHSDTETILHLYEEYGDDCVNHLRGMFAFAIWDADKRQLVSARSVRHMTAHAVERAPHVSRQAVLGVAK